MENGKSNIEVTKDGIQNTNGIEVICPTCRGKKTIPDPQYYGQMMCYCGPNGERSPHIMCRTCCGTGWIFEPHA